MRPIFLGLFLIALAGCQPAQHSAETAPVAGGKVVATGPASVWSAVVCAPTGDKVGILSSGDLFQVLLYDAWTLSVGQDPAEPRSATRTLTATLNIPKGRNCAGVRVTLRGYLENPVRARVVLIGDVATTVGSTRVMTFPANATNTGNFSTQYWVPVAQKTGGENSSVPYKMNLFLLVDLPDHPSAPTRIRIDSVLAEAMCD